MNIVSTITKSNLLNVVRRITKFTLNDLFTFLVIFYDVFAHVSPYSTV
jgi:hypothetical protein